MRVLRAGMLGACGLLALHLGCNQIVDITDPIRSMECDGPDGAPIPGQTPGDCVELVCDGAGRVRAVALESDTPDHGNICTLDTCLGTTPQHTPLEEVPCYSGPAGTAGQGACTMGVQQCDAAGNPVGGCVGEVVPAAEVCEAAGVDEDCDGMVNEEESCVCGDGYVSEGEECDDGGTSDEDTCSSTCQEQKILVLAAGGEHSCAVLSGGVVKCWGRNDYGQLGLGDTQHRGDDLNEMGDALPALNLGSGKIALALVAGYWHSCALLDNGSAKCWGRNNKGQLGVGDTVYRGDEPNEMGDALPAVKLFSQLW